MLMFDSSPRPSLCKSECYTQVDLNKANDKIQSVLQNDEKVDGWGIHQINKQNVQLLFM